VQLRANETLRRSWTGRARHHGQIWHASDRVRSLRVSIRARPRAGPGPRSWIRVVVLAAVAAQALGGAAEPTGGAPSRFAAGPGGAAAAPEPAAAGALQSYALADPDLAVVLPPQLSEVSGVTDISDTELGCVQDEDGLVFVYDLGRQQVTRTIRFGPPGDYEGIARAGSRLFVLRSDGVLFEIQGLSGTPPVRIHVLRLPASDIEGLCHDPRHGRLLVAPKSSLGKGRALEDMRAIFAYGLDKAALQPDPLLALSVNAIRTFAGRQVAGQQQKKAGKPRPALRFMPSAIAVHPATSEIFVVSAVDRALATFDRSGQVTGYASLDPGLFRQPEGLAFLANGDLVITNEAAGQKPTLLLFTRRAGGAVLSFTPHED